MRATWRGFTLIEVMIAMAMIALGLVGLMQLEVVAARSGSSSTRVEQGTNISRDLASALEALPYDSALLSDSDTSNDCALKNPGYLLGVPATARIDHCLGDSSQWPPALASNCQDFQTLNSAASPPGDLPDGGGPMFFMGWDVEDANLSGSIASYADGGMVTTDGKVVVSRVIWRDPALGNLRSADTVSILNNPSISQF